MWTRVSQPKPTQENILIFSPERALITEPQSGIIKQLTKCYILLLRYFIILIAFFVPSV
mgnify:CR=1 FL=1